MQNLKRIIVVGTSMGGLSAIENLLGVIPTKEVAILIVQHLADGRRSKLDKILSKKTGHTIHMAKNDQPIKSGCIYISPSEYHLMIKDKKLQLGGGLKENGSRPSINQLFRSAAVNFKERVIGVVLTGLLADGAKGLNAIKEMGGTTIVQDPDEAEYPEMPLSAIRRAPIDYVSEISDMGSLIRVLLKKEIIEIKRQPNQELMDLINLGFKGLNFNNEELVPEYDQDSITVEDSLLATLQMLQEKINSLELMAENALLKEKPKAAKFYFNRAHEERLHTQNIRKHLKTMQIPTPVN